MFRLPLAVMVGLMLLLAACSGTPANSSPAANATADDDGGPTGTDAAGEDDGSATETQDAGGDDGAANPGGATDLEALLPDEVNGVQLGKASFDGGNIDEETAGFSLEGIASAAGVSPDDVSFAYATDEGAGQVTIFAIRIEGRSGEETLDAFLEHDATGLSEAAEETNVGGKDVLTASGVIYLYASDDVLFEILAEPEFAEDALSQLP